MFLTSQDREYTAARVGRGRPTESIVIPRRGAVLGGRGQVLVQTRSPGRRPLFEAVVGQTDQPAAVEPYREQVAIGLGLVRQADLLGREPGAAAGEDDPAAVGREVG